MATNVVGLDDSQRLQRIQALAHIGCWEWHPASGHMHWSQQLRQILGFSSAETLDYATFRSLVHAEDLPAFDRTIASALDGGERFQSIHRMYLSDRSTVRVFQFTGEIVRDDEGAPVVVFATGADITDQQAAKKELAHLATHDPLTGLPNRRSIIALLEERLTGNGDDPGVLLMIDIDRFKDINDLRGHAAGDQVMRSLASTLTECLPDSATVGRLGGDEFAVVLPHENIEGARSLAEELCDAVNGRPFLTSNEALRLTVSVGIASLAEAIDDVTVLANADLALYAAKAAGRNRACVFAPEQHARASERLSVQQRLAAALDNDTLSLLAQPIIDLTSDQISAYELLLRLDDGHTPELGPSLFLPTAERSSLATRVDRWVVDRAIAALASPAARRRGLCLQVNVTGRSLQDEDFGTQILQALNRAGVSSHRLGFEITETTTMGNVEAVRRLVERLGSAGCPIVLDDFGTGFGSLVPLRNVPFAAVKIAGVFLAQAEHGHPNLTVIDGIVRLARGLGMQVIAEEVDRAPLLEALREVGVRGAQGWVCGAPRPLEQVLAGLA